MSDKRTKEPSTVKRANKAALFKSTMSHDSGEGSVGRSSYGKGEFVRDSPKGMPQKIKQRFPLKNHLKDVLVNEKPVPSAR